MKNKFLVRFIYQNNILFIYIIFFFQDGVMGPNMGFVLCSQPVLSYAVCFLLASSGRVLYGLYCGRYVEKIESYSSPHPKENCLRCEIGISASCCFFFFFFLWDNLFACCDPVECVT